MAKQPSKGAKTPIKTTKRAKAGEDSGELKPAAVLLDAIPPEVHKADEQPLELVNPVPPEVDDVPAEPASESAPVAEAKPEPTPVSPIAGSPAEPKKSGFLPLVFGGLLAGAIGFVVAYMNPAGDSSDLESEIRELRQRVSAMEPADLGPIEVAQAELAEQIDFVQSDLSNKLNDVSARLADLESLPQGDGTIADRSIAAYEADLAELRAQMSEMQSSAETQLGAARAEAAAIEENAAAAARAAAGRAALSRIQTGLESGAPLGAALADLEAAIGGPAPDALLAVQDGVPTLGALQEGFPDVARSALATARSEGVAGEETIGFGAFLRNQFDVRSAAPQDGTTVDAVLSRAEAAVQSGRLADGLAEIAALPEVARGSMTDWLALAESRADAIAAVDILFTSLNEN